MKIRTLIVDNTPSGDELFDIISPVSNFKVLAVLDDINKALKYIDQGDADCVFLREGVGDPRHSGDSSFVANYIREWKKDILTVLYSDDRNYALMAFRMGAADFFTLPPDQDDLTRVMHHLEHQMDLIQHRNQNRSEGILVKTKNGYKMINVSDILFIERVNRQIIMLCEGGSRIQLSGYTMDELERLLKDTSLYRCYQSFIVNLSRINSIESDPGSRNCTLRINGYDGVVYLSRQRYKEVLNVLEQQYAHVKL